jgi:hypothetical protein
VHSHVGYYRITLSVAFLCIYGGSTSASLVIRRHGDEDFGEGCLLSRGKYRTVKPKIRS